MCLLGEIDEDAQRAARDPAGDGRPQEVPERVEGRPRCQRDGGGHPNREIAEKIMLLINNPKLGVELGKNGRNLIMEKWRWKIQIENLEKLLVAFSKKK